MREALAKGVSDHQKCTFDIDPSHFPNLSLDVCNGSQLKQHSLPVSWTKLWKPIRARYWARTIVSCLRSAHARRPLWEPPDMLIFRGFNVKAPFEAIFKTVLSEKGFQMEPKIVSKILENLTNSTFDNISLKPEAWTIVKNMEKVLKIHPKSIQIDPGAERETMLKNIAQQIRNYARGNSQIHPRNWSDFRGGASGSTFGAPSRFWASKVGPQSSQSQFGLPLIDKWIKNEIQEPIDCEKTSESQDFSEPGLADCAKRFQFKICYMSITSHWKRIRSPTKVG